MAASRTNCLCSDFLAERYMPTYAFLRLDANHYSSPPAHPLPATVPSFPGSASIHPLHPKHRLALKQTHY